MKSWGPMLRVLATKGTEGGRGDRQVQNH